MATVRPPLWLVQLPYLFRNSAPQGAPCAPTPPPGLGPRHAGRPIISQLSGTMPPTLYQLDLAPEGQPFQYSFPPESPVGLWDRITLRWGMLGTAGCGAASLVSAYQMAVAPPPQLCPDIANCPLL